MKSVDKVKRSVKRFLLRTGLLAVLVLLGAMSIAKSQRDPRNQTPSDSAGPQAVAADASPQPIVALKDATPLQTRFVSERASQVAPHQPMEAAPVSHEETYAPEGMAEEGETFGSSNFDTGAYIVDDADDYGTEPDYAQGLPAPPDFSQVQPAQLQQTADRDEPVAAPSSRQFRNPIRKQLAPGGAVPDLLQPGDTNARFESSAPDASAEVPATPPAAMPPQGLAQRTEDFHAGQYLPPGYDHTSDAESADQFEPPQEFESDPQAYGAMEDQPSPSDYAPPSARYAPPPGYEGTPEYTAPSVAPRAENTVRSDTMPPASYEIPRTSPPQSYPPASEPAPAESWADRNQNPAASPRQPAANAAPEDAARRMVDAMNAAGVPGAKELEGPQSPNLIVQKEVPTEIQVGQPARLALRIRNVGQSTANEVEVHDLVPRGTRLVKTNPEARVVGDGELHWNLGSITPGSEAIVEMHVEPLVEGRIGSVANVTFAAAATASTLVTKPNLTLEHTGPREVMIGDMVRFSIQISNSGSGTAERVILEEEVPPGLSHTSGEKLEYEVGSIRPGETRHLELTLKAAQAGTVDNLIMAHANGGVQVQHTTQLEVVAPQLQIRIEGPNRRYLNRTAVYNVLLENPGSAAATNVDLSVQLPDGLTYVNANNAGQYDESRHAVRWNLASLPSKKRGRVQFTVMPSKMGDLVIRAASQAQLGLADNQEHLVTVDGVPALYFGVADAIDPIEVGGITSYEIRVVNQGSKAATNVRLIAELPEGLEAVRAEGATSGQVSPRHVEFEPIAQLVPQQELKFRVDVKGAVNGDWRFSVTMTSDETTTPVTKQESTHVYSDQ